MKKKFLLDTNVLLTSPRSLYVFEDNDVYISETTLIELDKLKTSPGDVGYSARSVIREINSLKQQSGQSLLSGIGLPGGGTLIFIPDTASDKNTLNDDKIIYAAKEQGAVLVTNDISMALKAEIQQVPTETYKNEKVSVESLSYSGTQNVLTDAKGIAEFYSSGSLNPEKFYRDSEYTPPQLLPNEYVILTNAANSSHTAIGYFDGNNVRRMSSFDTRPFGIYPRNVAQKFAIDALTRSAEDCPLVILKGPAGTAKTFLSLACGLHQVINEQTYKKILILRPNIKFDEDIGYLKGDEMEKILPLIRPCLDNLETLVSEEHDTAEETNKKVQDLFDKGFVAAEAMAYLRGRSINNTYILIDEAQNTTPSQMLGIITRAGIGSKIVIVGDPDQIDNPRVDKQNNGLVFAADRMKGSKQSAILSFSQEECVRSPLALEASVRLNRNTI